MIGSIAGLPAKIKTVLDRLSSQRAGYLDYLTSISSWTSATNAKVPDNAVWTNSLATQLGTLTTSVSKAVMFTATANWTCPANVTLIWATVVGGGGAGGGRVNAGNGPCGGGGGGGGGGIAYRVPIIVVPTTVYAVTAGPGGTAVSGTHGNAGSNSSIGSLIVIGGGGGGGVATANGYSADNGGGGGAGWLLGGGGASGGLNASNGGSAVPTYADGGRGLSAFEWQWGGSGGGQGSSYGGNGGWDHRAGYGGDAGYYWTRSGGGSSSGGNGACSPWGYGAIGSVANTDGVAPNAGSYGCGGGGAGYHQNVVGIGGNGHAGLVIIEYIG